MQQAKSYGGIVVPCKEEVKVAIRENRVDRNQK